jgi:hypothetical protein
MSMMPSVVVGQASSAGNPGSYTPDDQHLYDTILVLDSLFFTAYNTCNMELQADFYADDIEFYHDQGGLMTSKTDLLNAIKMNICGKVTRELVKGSVEVYPIGKYGAVEMGIHKFHNLVEGSTSQGGRFVIIWVHHAN